MKIGILLPVFSLPNEYGIGDFGPEAYQFIDILKNNNLNCWEVLPINPIDFDNSPYSPISSLAIEPLFISIDLLKDIGLLKDTYKMECKTRIDYGMVRINKDKVFREAFFNFKVDHELYSDYLKYLENDNEYAKFIALKKANNNASWINFKNGFDEDEYRYQVFLQFMAKEQWIKLKKYANDNNIEIFGDLPIYVNYESSDVYFHQKDFILEDKKMKFVSGASPDYFSADGQKWGHPLYNFENQKSDNYKYMISKYEYNDNLFDIIRIDHFRAFESFFKIPIDEAAINGVWIKGPGSDLLDKIFKKVNSSKYIVEDLGAELEEVYKLRDRYKLEGMKIFEYTFDFKNIKDNCPDTVDMIVYPGNHDNNTIIGWYKTLSDDEKESLNKFLDKYPGEINEKIIRYLMSMPAKYLVFMIQDILGLDGTSRINIPGIIDNQWNYRLESFKNIDTELNKFFNE